MNFKNSSLIYINILTSVQYHSILKGISPSKRQYVLLTCTKICISPEITSLQQHTRIQIYFENANTMGERQVPNTVDDYSPM